MGLELFLLHWLYVHFGVNGAGAYYGFWSGIGSDIGEISIFAAMTTGIAMLWHKHNCEAKGCWRLIRHTTEAGHLVCRKHHPEGAPTAQQIHDAHHAAKRAKL